MIIDFNKKNNHQEYNKRLKATTADLSDMSLKLFDLGLKLALTDKWKEWSDSMPVGSEFNFDNEMLLDTGDNIVTRIIKLKIEIDNLTMVIDKLVK